MSTYVTRVHRKTESVKPWNSVNAGKPPDKYVPIHYQEEQADIDLCLSCPLPPEKCCGIGYCYKMLDGQAFKTRRRTHGKFDNEKFFQMCEQGRSSYRIAKEMNVTRTAVTLWKKKYGFDKKDR